MFYDTLVVKQKECPPSCTLCMDACNKRDGNIFGSAIYKNNLPEANYHSVLLCNQCSQPECLNICPMDAIRRNDFGVVTVDNKKCIGCGLCTLACQYGGIHLDTKKKKSYKCDMCDGEPACSVACPNGVLVNQKANDIVAKLGEDVSSPGLPFCAGCLMELLARFTLRVLGKNIVLFGAPSCCVIGGRAQVPFYGTLMTNLASSMTGVKRYYQRIGKDVTCVALAGDGSTADIGFQVLSAAAERGENIVYICYDNEGYMNTGIQRSSTTPLGSWTTTTQVGPKKRGKKEAPKNIPLLMAAHEIPYTATATMSDLDDYARKLQKAVEASKEGLAYLHVLCPCPTGWKSSTEEAIELCRAAVETNYFPLWEAEYGEIRLTHEESQPKTINEFIKYMGRFSHFNEEEVEHIQAYVDNRYKKLKKLSTL